MCISCVKFLKITTVNRLLICFYFMYTAPLQKKLYGGRIPILNKNRSYRDFSEERNLNSISVAILNFSVETIAFV